MRRGGVITACGAGLSCLGTALIGRVTGPVALMVGAVCLGAGLPLVAWGMGEPR